MEHTVKIHRNGGTGEIKAEAGTNLLEFLRKNGVQVDSPCGGNGSCGKCRVQAEGLVQAPSEKEMQLLGRSALEKGLRLACYNTVAPGLEVYVQESRAKASIVTGGKSRNVRLSPRIGKEYMELPAPSLEDQDSDLERLLAFSGGALAGPGIEIARELPQLLRASDYKVTLVTSGGLLTAVEPGNTAGRLFGAAFDIGTTTIAAYLYDLKKGNCTDVVSTLNPQIKFGADVISRIEHTLSAAGGKEDMHKAVIGCINLILEQFCERNGIGSDDIYSAVFAGNTTMMHFLMDLYAGNIAVSPFIPATTRMHEMDAADLGLGINRRGRATVLPGLSAYIGADTLAAVLSSGMYEDAEISLLIDIGTNGEVVLGCRDWLLSCSTAAGPAFEGANIRNGVGGVSGAIDSVRLLPEFAVTTLDDGEPIGICGSGIVDVIAQMLEAGLLDETGRLQDADELGPDAERYADRLVSIGGVKAFSLVSDSGGRADGGIAVTQRDVRELQNAKAAIAAGIRTLIKRAGIAVKDVRKVYLAGGFGSRINIGSALKIGLLPEELGGRIESIGNAAGSGAAECLLSAEMLEAVNGIKRRMKYIELSASAEFTTEYVECMLF